MPEELQNLLERIQKDGVDKAEAEAKTIVDGAKAKAKTIVENAQTEAKQALEKAEVDSQQFTERAKHSLEQAARDVILSVGDAVSRTFQDLVGKELAQTMSNKALEKMLTEVVSAYSNADQGASIAVLLSDEQKTAVIDHFKATFAAEMKKGLEIKSDSSVVSGFRVSLTNNNIEHDFTGPAITSALCQLLRPHIAEIVRNAMTEEKS